ncbi:MAG: hypothetical protein CMD46_01835 [Gammaproteobacteria bacterium]|nr:hypothetical protein [Gammaproteobacteria bacterium]
MNSIAFIILALTSLYVFFKLGKVKASGKQLNRDNRINRFRNKEQGNIIEGESQEVKDDEE